MLSICRRLLGLASYSERWLAEQRMGEKWLFHFHDSRIRG